MTRILINYYSDQGQPRAKNLLAHTIGLRRDTLERNLFSARRNPTLFFLKFRPRLF